MSDGCSHGPTTTEFTDDSIGIYTATPIPEPSTLVLLLSALFALALGHRALASGD